MHSLPSILAAWRLQADTVSGMLNDRDLKPQATQLKSILRQLDQIWSNELGDAYTEEIINLIKLIQADAEFSIPDETACTRDGLSTLAMKGKPS